MTIKPGKHAPKAVDKAFRELGATRQTVRAGTAYTFPDGARRLVPPNTSWAAAHAMIREARDRYGHHYERPPLMGERLPQSEHPTLDLKRLYVTEHARQRFTEMGEQDTLDAREIVHALQAPNEVLWCKRPGTYTWVGHRIAAVGHISDDGWLTIRTLLWTTTELWDRNPRLEKAQ